MLGKSVLLGVAGVFIGISAGYAQTTFSRECALQDLSLVTSIEELGDAQSLPSAKLSEAYFSVLKARAACRSGQFADAWRLYSEVPLRFMEATASTGK
jgi:hypothetical protein